MASSMTMPTMSTSASMVTLFSVKPRAHIMPKVEMTEAGMATAAMMVDCQFRMKASTTRRREDAAEHEVQVDLVQRRVDVARLVADDLERARPAGIWRAERARGSALAASMTATVFSPDCRRTSRMTVGTPFSRATERCSVVPSSARPTSRTRMGAPLTVAIDQVVEGARIGDAPQRAERRLARGPRSRCRRACRRSAARARRAPAVMGSW